MITVIIPIMHAALAVQLTVQKTAVKPGHESGVIILSGDRELNLIQGTQIKYLLSLSVVVSGMALRKVMKKP